MLQDVKALITVCSEEGEDSVSQTQLTMTDKQFKRSSLMAAAAHRMTQEGTRGSLVAAGMASRLLKVTTETGIPKESPHHGPVG